MTHAASSVAASSSAARAPTPIPAQEYRPLERATPTTPTSATVFSTIQSDVRTGAIRVEISDPEDCSLGDVAILQTQETKRVREIGSLIFDAPLQHGYEAGVEARSLLSTEVMEEVDRRLAVTDMDPNGQRYVKFGLMTSTVAQQRSKLRITWLTNMLQNGNSNNSQCRSLRSLCLAKGVQNLENRAHQKGERGQLLDTALDKPVPLNMVVLVVVLVLLQLNANQQMALLQKFLLKVMCPKVALCFR